MVDVSPAAKPTRKYHKQVLLPLLSLIAVLPLPCAAQLVRWLSVLPTSELQQMVSVCQQFVTVRLYQTQRIDVALRPLEVGRMQH